MSAVAILAEGGNSLTHTVFAGPVLLAVPIALLAGLVSFASPCVLPLVPGYIGYVSSLATAQASSPPHDPAAAMAAVGAGASSEIKRPARWRVVAGVLLFIAGFTAVFVALGVFFGTIGQFLLRWDSVIERVLGVVIIVMGLAFWGLIPALERDRPVRITARAGLWGAPVLGIAFGLGWTPCLGPTLTAINALALDGGSGTRGAILATAYCLGLGIPFVIVAFSMSSSAAVMGFLRRHRRAVMAVGAGLLILLGAAMATGLWGFLASRAQGWVSGFELPL
ncbi:cytochrome c biogenesis CcdA family protein [Rarobacter incanus]|uniref:Cytochrome c-type biogenesis protein n=1 Tax=Rarobacter incanus TaxID=153494 RepID=A0A542SQS8_9MICO|nr:cytochrome c biogenesis protein CcdA [Rarobacter incanus]TQK76948.1 cytochrome c-type biogenesis protein [Rarobacter incanus]